jgi:hypothetical protein
LEPLAAYNVFGGCYAVNLNSVIGGGSGQAVTIANPSHPLHHLKLILLYGVMFGRLLNRTSDRSHS